MATNSTHIIHRLFHVLNKQPIETIGLPLFVYLLLELLSFAFFAYGTWRYRFAGSRTGLVLAWAGIIGLFGTWLWLLVSLVG